MKSFAHKILAAGAFLLSPALIAEPVSISPNKLITIQQESPDVNGERFYWIVDKRNRGEKFFLFESNRIFTRHLYTEWSRDSFWVKITAGDEKAWSTDFLILRIDAKSGLYFFAPPQLPDLKSLLLDKTKENPAALRVDRDSGPFGFEAQPPEFREPPPEDGSSKGKALPVNQFVIDLAEMDAQGTTSEKGVSYHFYFETKEWVRFKLLKITRTGEAAPEAYQPDSDPSKPLILFELQQSEKRRKKVAPRGAKNEQPTREPWE